MCERKIRRSAIKRERQSEKEKKDKEKRKTKKRLGTDGRDVKQSPTHMAIN